MSACAHFCTAWLMMPARDMPLAASQIAEAVVTMGEHKIAVRPGAGALIDGLLATCAADAPELGSGDTLTEAGGARWMLVLALGIFWPRR